MVTGLRAGFRRPGLRRHAVAPSARQDESPKSAHFLSISDRPGGRGSGRARRAGAAASGESSVCGPGGGHGAPSRSRTRRPALARRETNRDPREPGPRRARGRHRHRGHAKVDWANTLAHHARAGGVDTAGACRAAGVAAPVVRLRLLALPDGVVARHVHADAGQRPVVAAQGQQRPRAGGCGPRRRTPTAWTATHVRRASSTQASTQYLGASSAGSTAAAWSTFVPSRLLAEVMTLLAVAVGEATAHDRRRQHPRRWSAIVRRAMVSSQAVNRSGSCSRGSPGAPSDAWTDRPCSQYLPVPRPASPKRSAPA